MNRIALYARVSTRDQHIEPQLDALRSYAEARRLEVVAEYVDHGVSGAKDRRPALDLMMREAKRRRFDAVAAVKLDRIARSVRHLTTLAAELEAVGVDLVVTDQAIDTSTPSGRLLFNVLGAMAEFERDLICERTSAGMQPRNVGESTWADPRSRWTAWRCYGAYREGLPSRNLRGSSAFRGRQFAGSSPRWQKGFMRAMRKALRFQGPSRPAEPWPKPVPFLHPCGGQGLATARGKS